MNQQKWMPKAPPDACIQDPDNSHTITTGCRLVNKCHSVIRRQRHLSNTSLRAPPPTSLVSTPPLTP
ncbi:hypothetical protein LSH36_265g01051, partial [Paralvinella palmiformis]